MTVLQNNVFYEPSLHDFRVKDPWSALTHFVGFLAAIIAMPVLLIRASVLNNSLMSMISYAVFMLSMIVLYGASTSYHSFNISPKGNRVLKKIDHVSIFYLIAGSYTPVCLVGMHNRAGYILLGIIWFLALAGTVFKLCWVTCPKWVIFRHLYGHGLGMHCLPAAVIDISCQTGAFQWLLAGGIMYTVGAVFYAVKPKWLNNPDFGNHEVFHCFVLAGSFCHFIVVYQYLCMIG